MDGGVRESPGSTSSTVASRTRVPGGGQQGHPVAQGREPAHQRDNDPLGAAVAGHGQPLLRCDRDVHDRQAAASGVGLPAGGAPFSRSWAK